MEIELKNIHNFILNGVNLKIDDGEILVLVGRTGAGKTTLLNVIAGLVPYEGAVIIGGEPVDDVPVRERGVGYLFQDAALFPHLDVKSNISYGLKARKRPKSEMKGRVDALIDLVRIRHIADRYTGNLSGGEKRRVALARALAPKPAILLMDEPFSSLDSIIAKHLRMEFRRIQKKLGITTIYVTHDLREAEEMAHRIAVIHDGILEQVGTPEDVFFSPRNERVHDFVGGPNILECDSCRILGHGLAEVNSEGMSIVVPYENEEIEKIVIYPDDVYVYSNQPPGPDINRFRGTVTGVEHFLSTTRLTLAVDGNTLVSEMPAGLFEGLNIEIDREVFLILKFRSVRVVSQKKSSSRVAKRGINV